MTSFDPQNNLVSMQIIISTILQKRNGEGNGNPLQYSCLENPMDGGAWKAAVHGVAKSQERLSDFTFTFHFHALEKEMATHSSILAWRIPGTEEPSRLPSMELHRVGHDWSDLAAAAAAAVCQILFYKWASWDTERFSHLPKVTQLTHGGVEIWTEVILIPDCPVLWTLPWKCWPRTMLGIRKQFKRC